MNCKPNLVNIVSIFKSVSQLVVYLIGKYWTRPKKNFALFSVLPEAVLTLKEWREIWKPGCSEDTGQASADLSTTWSAPWPQQVTNNESWPDLCFIAFHPEIWNVTDGRVLTDIQCTLKQTKSQKQSLKDH